MQRPISAIVVIILVIVGSVALAGIAATIALTRPAGGRLDTDLRSALRADYSADPRGARLAPVSEEIIDAAREDEEALQREAGEREIVQVFRPDGDGGQSVVVVPDGTPSAPEPTATDGTGTPVATRTPTATPSGGPTPRPTATLPPGSTPAPTAAPTATPKPPPTATPTPTPPPNLVSLASIADSYVSQLSPSTNFGTATRMHVDASERSLLLFDLSEIPIGANVSSAELVLCASSIDPGAAGRTHQITRPTSSWTETGVTWNNQPGGNTGSAMPFTVPAAPGCFSIDVTPALQALAQGGPNYGFRIRDQDEGTAVDVEYASREDAVPGLRPTLNVTFTDP